MSNLRTYRHLILCAATLLFAACQPNPPGAGTEGHVCRNWPASACDEGLNCTWNNTCEQCGADGQDCCVVAGGTAYCDEGFACEGSVYEEQICQNDCGMIGLPCCPDGFTGGMCPGSGTCNLDNGMCEGDGPPAPCTVGKYLYSVMVIDGLCSGWTEVVFKADTAAQAEECRQLVVAQAAPDAEVCLVGQKPAETTVCKHSINGDDPVNMAYCDAARISTCEQNWCLDGCTWSAGACD